MKDYDHTLFCFPSWVALVLPPQSSSTKPTQFLSENHLLYPNHSSFKGGHSSDTAIYCGWNPEVVLSLKWRLSEVCSVGFKPYSHAGERGLNLTTFPQEYLKAWCLVSCFQHVLTSHLWIFSHHCWVDDACPNRPSDSLVLAYLPSWMKELQINLILGSPFVKYNETFMKSMSDYEWPVNLHWACGICF